MSDTKALVSKCQSLTAKGMACSQQALPGYPFCYQHIRSMTGKMHDRYSDVMPPELDPHYQHQLKDDKQKDLGEEIALIRTMLRSHAEKLKAKYQAAVEKAEEEGGEVGNVVSMTDIASMLQMIEHIGRMTERQAKITPDRVITVPEVMAIMTKIIDVINEHVPAEQIEIRNNIVGGIQKHVTGLLSAATEHTYGSNP